MRLMDPAESKGQLKFGNDFAPNRFSYDRGYLRIRKNGGQLHLLYGSSQNPIKVHVGCQLPRHLGQQITIGAKLRFGFELVVVRLTPLLL